MKIQVLDHGYVEFIEAWGIGKDGVCHDPGGDVGHDYEVGIIEAARQSTQGGFRGWDPAPCDCQKLIHTELPGLKHEPECNSVKNPGDARLLAYLYNNKHMTPFEFSGAVLEIQAPIFVFREWQRHRTQSYNEASARYAPLPDLNYIPSIERIMRSGGTNKQAQGLGIVGLTDADIFQSVLERQYQGAQIAYEESLKAGIPKELARLVLPVGRYSKMRASANLRNWLQFLTLRLDPAAQWEIRQFAEAVGTIIERTFPRTWTLFQQHRNS